MPYRFFALSNAGSMLGLLTYPVLVEPYLTSGAAGLDVVDLLYGFRAGLRRRLRGGRAIRTAMAAASGVARPAGAAPHVVRTAGLDGPRGLRLRAAAGRDQPPDAEHRGHPFLWVLPLSLYLLSFILCFDSDRWYSRWLFTRLGAMALPAMAYAISSGERHFGI